MGFDSKKCPPAPQVIQGFETLRAAMIDASSVIYIRKSGFFETLLKCLRLYSPVEIIHELGDDADSIEPATCPAIDGTNDRKFVACAAALRLAVISDDRGIITAARKADLPAYNALMMLNFLLWKRRLQAGHFTLHRDRLRHFAWYAPGVWEYAESVTTAIASCRHDGSAEN
jgi:hypothetical protein